MSNHTFDDAVNSVSTTLGSKRDIYEYFKDMNGGDSTKAASAAARFISGKSSGKEYRNARRNFEGKRATELGATSKWKEVGKELPRQLKDSSIEITVKGQQKGNKGRPMRDRTIKVTLKGDKAQKFVDNPTWASIWDEYGFDFGIEEDGDIDADYTLQNVSVSAA